MFSDKLINDSSLLNRLQYDDFVKTINYSVNLILNQQNKMKITQFIQISQTEGQKLTDLTLNLIYSLSSFNFNANLLEQKIKLLRFQKQKSDYLKSKINDNLYELRKIIYGSQINDLTEVQKLDWRFEIQLASKSCKNTFNPNILMHLKLKNQDLQVTIKINLEELECSFEYGFCMNQIRLQNYIEIQNIKLPETVLFEFKWINIQLQVCILFKVLSTQSLSIVHLFIRFIKIITEEGYLIQQKDKMQDNNQSILSQSSIKGSDLSSRKEQRSLFLTQQNNFSPLRKKAKQVKEYAQQVQKGQVWQMNKLCDKLLDEVGQLKTHEILSSYRQLNRNLSQNSLEQQGELNKLQKINSIDISYLRKKLQNQPVVDFNYLNQRLSIYQKESREVTELIQKYYQRVLYLEKQFG